MADEEYTSLPIDDLITHKLWKARQHGYEQLKSLAEADLNDPHVQSIVNSPDMLRKIVADANVIAQESGIDLLVVVLQKSDPKVCTNTRDSVVPALVEKGITSSRANAKASATESLLIYVQKDTPEKIIELMIPSLNAKSPKQVVATIKAIDEIYKSFGCSAISPKFILESICKMFAHSDKNVRAEATKLSVTIRSYIGDAFDSIVFPKIKPIQQKDLTALFLKIDQVPTPTKRLFEEEQKLLGNSQINDDVEMTDIIYTTKEDLKIDPYDLETPVDVLSKIPSNLSERLSNSVWKERVEVLEEISKIFKVVRIENDDFSYFVSLMATCIKDVNLQVVTLACGILADLVNGLKHNFGKYVSTLINPLLERTKEKKKSVLDALKTVLDLCFKYGSFNEIADSIIEHMSHISPLVKVESMNFLVRCLKEIKTPIGKHHEEQIMETATKLLQDSQLGVRNAASEVLGTMMKLLGPEKSKKYIEKVDKRHVKKVEQIRDSADVKLSNKLAPTETFIEAAVVVEPVRGNNVTEGTIINQNEKIMNQRSLRPPVPSKSSIPSKRTATSPIKENIPNSKNALTSRSLKASTSNDTTNSTQRLHELEILKTEKQELFDLKKNLTTQLESLQASNAELMKDIVTLNNKLDDYHDKFTTMNMTLKSKDTQLFRLRSDLESSNARNAQLQQKVRYLESQLENQGSKTTKSSDDDINRRISILSIDSNTQEVPESSLNLANSALFTMNDNDDEWKRATAATNDLKAKIQRIKARTRIVEPTED